MLDSYGSPTHASTLNVQDGGEIHMPLVRQRQKRTRDRNEGFLTTGTVTTMNNTALTVRGGTQFALPEVPAIELTTSRTILADDPGSRIDLSGVTSLQTPTNQRLTVNATRGGEVILTGLTATTSARTYFSADGENSLIDL